MKAYNKINDLNDESSPISCSNSESDQNDDESQDIRKIKLRGNIEQI